MKGSWRLIRREPAVWFIAVGAASYLVASLQGSLQAFRSANALLHFTNHTVGHAHFAAYGFVSFLLFGAVYGLVPHITGARDIAMRIRLHFWLALGGMALYVVSMVVAGVVQGLSWADGRPFIESVVAIKRDPRRRGRTHDARPCGVRLESLADAPAAAHRRGLGLART